MTPMCQCKPREYGSWPRKWLSRWREPNSKRFTPWRVLRLQQCLAADGRARGRLVRHGHGPERAVQTGIGPVAVQPVRLRDRAAGEAGPERIRFTSAILSRWAE